MIIASFVSICELHETHLSEYFLKQLTFVSVRISASAIVSSGFVDALCMIITVIQIGRFAFVDYCNSRVTVVCDAIVYPYHMSTWFRAATGCHRGSRCGICNDDTQLEFRSAM